jgi:hypothetical protein
MQVRRVWLRELVPTLAPQSLDADVMSLKLFEGQWIDGVARMASGAERKEFAAERRMIGERLRHDRARGVSRTQEEHVQWCAIWSLHREESGRDCR